MGRSTPPAYWALDDLAGLGDLADEYGVTNSTVSNWTTRYADFPPPLTILSVGPVYSRWQIRQWHDRRDWKPSGNPHRQP